MTMLYRVQTHHPEEEWTTQWCLDKPEALKALQGAKTMGLEAHADHMVVPTDRKQLCEAMNQAQVNREVWPGEMVARVTP